MPKKNELPKCEQRPNFVDRCGKPARLMRVFDQRADGSKGYICEACFERITLSLRQAVNDSQETLRKWEAGIRDVVSYKKVSP